MDVNSLDEVLNVRSAITKSHSVEEKKELDDLQLEI